MNTYYVPLISALINMGIVTVLGFFLNKKLSAFNAENAQKLAEYNANNAKEIEKIRSSVNTWLSVQNIRIKKEFDAMEDIWNNLLETYDVLGSAYATVRDSGILSEEEIKKVSIQYIAYNKAVNKNKPFLPQKIFSSVHAQKHIEIIQTSFLSAIQSYGREESTDSKLYDKKHLEEFGIYADSVCEEIRQRMMSYDELMQTVSE